MKKLSYRPGQFAWADVMTKDVNQAKAFYKAVLGWGAEDMKGPDGEWVYTMFQLGGRAVAGLGAMPADLRAHGVPCHWSSYVSVENVDATADRVKELGGEVRAAPMDVFEDGRMAVFTDPGGAGFSCWQPKAHIGAELVNEPGALCWNELYTRDADAASKFYGELFGWRFVSDDNPDFPYTSISDAEGAIGGAVRMQGERFERVPTHWAVYFAVDDADAAAGRIEAHGGETIVGLMDVDEVGRFGAFNDDQGAGFSIIQLRTAT